MHAHICQVCAKNGKETVFVHSDDNAGSMAAHKCPECGSIEWKKAIVRQPNAAHVHRNVTPQRHAGNEILITYIYWITLLYLAIQVGALIGDIVREYFIKEKAE